MSMYDGSPWRVERCVCCIAAVLEEEWCVYVRLFMLERTGDMSVVREEGGEGRDCMHGAWHGVIVEARVLWGKCCERCGVVHASRLASTVEVCALAALGWRAVSTAAVVCVCVFGTAACLCLSVCVF